MKPTKDPAVSYFLFWLVLEYMSGALSKASPSDKRGRPYRRASATKSVTRDRMSTWRNNK